MLDKPHPDRVDGRVELTERTDVRASPGSDQVLAKRRAQFDRIDPPGWAGELRPEEAPHRIVEQHVQWMRQVEQQPENPHHAAEKHLWMDAANLDRRLQKEDNVDHATAFRSAEALATTELRAFRSAEAMRDREKKEIGGRESFSVELPAAELLGPDWREHVHGRSRARSGYRDTEFPDDTTIYAQWRRTSDGEWGLFTCYPKVPSPKRPRSG